MSQNQPEQQKSPDPIRQPQEDSIGQKLIN